jgi:hypothetical protein
VSAVWNLVVVIGCINYFVNLDTTQELTLMLSHRLSLALIQVVVFFSVIGAMMFGMVNVHLFPESFIQ